MEKASGPSSADSSSRAGTDLPAPRADEHTQLAHLTDANARAQAFASKARAENTKRAYRADWKQFVGWCEERGVRPLPALPKTVVLYVSAVADDYKLSTLERKLTAISQAHKTAGFDSPALTAKEPLHSVWAGIARTKSRAKDKVAPLMTDELRMIVDALPRTDENLFTTRALRDRALLLVGFAGALRRSELVGLQQDDVNVTADGLRLIVRKSKSDQEGKGLVKGIHYGKHPHTCPVRALRDWTRRASISEGPLFRGIDRHGNIRERALSGRSVALILKKAVKRAGLNPEAYSGHSLRAGFTTQAAREGVPERVIMKHTGHKSIRMVREYIREGQLFDENPTDALGL
ncbi:site-specific integrase [Salisaeta longa]|uniref:tyrosine-type recombinase/integrase n=1 Tax=Salisaeta longa TaxID=503170 RepID=UPI0003B71FC4|nr:site-specific integrase [Salisaeta longa]